MSENNAVEDLLVGGHREITNESNGNGHNENGFIVVPPTPQSSVESSSNNLLERAAHGGESLLTKESQEVISKLLGDLTDNSLSNRGVNTVVAEADSSSSKPSASAPPAPSNLTSKPKQDTASSSSTSCSLCPYYLLACDYLTKVQLSPKVKDLLLWSDPKYTGAVFGTSFSLLLSLSLFSFLTVMSTVLLILLTGLGSYRFYLALVFRIKGVVDPSFDKLYQIDVSLPKDKVKNLADLLEKDVNIVLNQIKSILLWDNIVTSSLAFVGLYFVYCIGCVFNTLTLLILALVSAFTLPKVYEVYKKPIDQAIEQATAAVHSVVKEVMKKVPFLNKKKVQ